MFSRSSAYWKLLEKIIRYPKVCILMIGVITCFWALQIPNLLCKTTIYDLIIEDLPENQYYKSFKEAFGSDEIIRVVIKANNIFKEPTFQDISQLSDNLSRINGVRRVISLPEIRKSVELSGKKSLKDFEEKIVPVNLFRNNLISDDRKTTAITLVLDNEADRDGVINAVQTVMAKTSGMLSLYQIGMPLVSKALADYTQKDFFTLPLITLAIILAVLFLLYRHWAMVVIPVSVVVLSLCWTFGLMALTRIPLSMLTMIVPVFLMAVGTAYCLHINTLYIEGVESTSTPVDAVRETFTKAAFPTSLAVLTTIIGLGSLMLNHIAAIQEFAVFSCLGMLSLWAISLTFFPAVLILLPSPPTGVYRISRFSGMFDSVLEKIITLNLRHQKITLPLLGLLTAFFICGMLMLRVETNPLEFFKKETPVRRHFDDISRDLSGSFPINVVMTNKTGVTFESVEAIRALQRAQRYLETLSGVDKAISFVDYLKLVNYATNRYQADYYSVPEEDFEVRMLLNSYETLLGEDMLNRFVTDDLTRANILLMTHFTSSNQFLSMRQEVLNHFNKNFSDNWGWEVTGFGIVISSSSHLLTTGQIKSLSVTLVLIFLIMFMMFLSLKVGLIALLPNLFPIVVSFGTMGWLGIQFSTATSLIASVAIGLAVDDTIHYLVRFNSEFKKDLDYDAAFSRTLMHVGKPIIFTTLTISAGFSILLFSNFGPTSMFGVMMVITMISALVGDLILLPSLMKHVALVTLWDFIRFRIGKDPGMGISLFRGMSRREIHTILLSGALKKFDAGEMLFRKGDVSNFMYAIVSGSLDVIDEPGSTEGKETPACSARRITTLKSGDIVGEMGLLRSQPRSATVISQKNSELIRINLTMLKRLQVLYPPTAYKFLFNLIRIMCNRLETTSLELLERFGEINLQGMLNKTQFIELLDVHNSICQRYGSDLSVCVFQLEFETPLECPDPEAVEWIRSKIVETMIAKIRKCDFAGEIDTDTYGLLLPNTNEEKARQLCYRLYSAWGKNDLSHQGVKGNIRFALAQYKSRFSETSENFLARATKAYQELDAV